MTYPGGKAVSYPHIINQITPHQVYIETHLGAGSVLASKKPVPVMNIGLDLDADVIVAARSRHAGNGAASRNTFLVIDAVEFLLGYDFEGSEFVYCDPPYVRSTRRSQKKIYKFEYTDGDHERLLDVLVGLPCNVAISGYESALYARRLNAWRTIEYQAQVRSGATATEWLWMNYEEPSALHDYSFLGTGWRERQKVHRQQARWVARLSALPRLERLAMLDKIKMASSTDTL